MQGQFKTMVCLLAVFWIVAPMASKVAQGQSDSSTPATSSADPDIAAKASVASPLVVLLRDAGVRAELKLSSSQTARLDAALAVVEFPLWYVRDAKDAATLANCARAFDHLEEAIAKTMQPEQRQRLDGILLQAQGWPVVLTPRCASDLQLSAEQLQQIRDLLAPREENNGPSAQPQGTTAGKVEDDKPEDRQAAILAVLSDAQREQLQKRIGPVFNVAAVRNQRCPAPAVQDMEHWINSEPLDWSKLKGKVVAVHFWAFGCVNCVRNLPHYQSWHGKYADQGLVVLGLHTPETSAERVTEAVKAKVSANQMLYPVAIDAEAKNWNAWANRWWPSVYLVDKQGYVRYWWYGELNWQGAEGEKFMRGKIEEILKEPAGP